MAHTDNPLDQFTLDLVRLNAVERMAGGETPVLILLRTRRTGCGCSTDRRRRSSTGFLAGSRGLQPTCRGWPIRHNLPKSPGMSGSSAPLTHGVPPGGSRQEGVADRILGRVHPRRPDRRCIRDHCRPHSVFPRCLLRNSAARRLDVRRIIITSTACHDHIKQPCHDRHPHHASRCLSR